MKKEWQKPGLEVLDVKMTMATTSGTHFDNDYTNGTPVPMVPGPGGGLIPAVMS
jgi:hypothetical protein